MTSSFLIPSIDLGRGQVATWVDGRVVPLPGLDPLALADRTAHLGLLHLVDLDAIFGHAAAGAPGAPNTAVMAAICQRYACRIAGGVRTPEDVLARIDLGARQVILSSALFGERGLDRAFLARLGQRVPRAQLVFALDVRDGELLRQGWGATTGLTVDGVVDDLAPQCSGFVLTAVEREGTALGPDLAAARRLRARTPVPLAVAGGIVTWSHVESLATIDARAVVSALQAETLSAERVG